MGLRLEVYKGRFFEAKGGDWIEKKKERQERERSRSTDSRKIAKTNFSIVLPSTYFMIHILQSVMNNMMNNIFL